MEELISFKYNSFKSVKLVVGLNKLGIQEFRFIFYRIKVL